VSKTPGTTARLDFYGVGQAQPPLLVLVDTPGYGYSARGKGRHGAWMARMAEYLRTRRTLSSGPTGSPLLARVMLLADARLGLTDLDHDVLAALDEARLPCHVVLTKADAVRSGEALAATAAAVAAGLRGYKMPFPHLSAVAAETGEGMPELAATLMHTAKLHRLTEADFAAHKAELGLREASAPRA
jgi:GTP-binding protein